MTEELAPAYRALYDKAGSVLQYRILRDLAHQDDTYIDALLLRQHIEKLPQVRVILSRQQRDGSWGNLDATEEAILHLCELGLSDCEAVRKGTQDFLFRRLFHREDFSRGVRDRVLRLLARTGFSAVPEVQREMQSVLSDWNDFLVRVESHKSGGKLDKDAVLPTWDAFEAICFHPWPDAEGEKVADAVIRVFAWAQENDWPENFIPRAYSKQRLFSLRRKEEYLAQPERMLYELELSARFGVTARMAATRWMLEELEAHQDADGFFRFDSPKSSSLSWYFPIEEPDVSNGHTTDWTFRGMLIFGALEFDV